MLFGFASVGLTFCLNSCIYRASYFIAVLGMFQLKVQSGPWCSEPSLIDPNNLLKQFVHGQHLLQLFGSFRGWEGGYSLALKLSSGHSRNRVGVRKPINTPCPSLNNPYLGPHWCNKGLHVDWRAPPLSRLFDLIVSMQMFDQLYICLLNSAFAYSVNPFNVLWIFCSALFAGDHLENHHHHQRMPDLHYCHRSESLLILPAIKMFVISHSVGQSSTKEFGFEELVASAFY